MEIAELDSLIDDLSIYMQSTGRKYADHAATLRSWSARKKRQQKPGAGIPDYTYNKEEKFMTETIQTAMDRLMTISAEPQDYIAGDGLLYCGSCNTPKGSVLPKRKKAVWA